MNLMEIARCNKSLHFKPRQPWHPDRPAIAWRHWLLCHFEGNGPFAISLADAQDLEGLVHELHPKLSLVELARLYTTWSQQAEFLQQSQWDWEKFFFQYELRYSHKLQKCFQQLTATSDDFQSWVEFRKLSPRDLQFLFISVDQKERNRVFDFVISMNPTRSQGIKALNLVTELVGMGATASDLMSVERNFDRWIDAVQKQRYPLSNAQEQTTNNEIERWPWPKSMDAKWSRRGDESGIEIKFLARSKADLDKKINGLEHVSKFWSNSVGEQ